MSQLTGIRKSGSAAIPIFGDVDATTYEFTINGVNFNGYGNIKLLTLDSDAKDDNPQTLHDAGSNYQVGTGKVFIAFQAMIYIYNASEMGRIGEADVKYGDGAGITKEVLKLDNGTNLPFMTPCVGVFGSGKFITAETTSNSVAMKVGSILYGVEVDA